MSPPSKEKRTLNGPLRVLDLKSPAGEDEDASVSTASSVAYRDDSSVTYCGASVTCDQLVETTRALRDHCPAAESGSRGGMRGGESGKADADADAEDENKTRHLVQMLEIPRSGSV